MQINQKYKWVPYLIYNVLFVFIAILIFNIIKGNSYSHIENTIETELKNFIISYVECESSSISEKNENHSKELVAIGRLTELVKYDYRCGKFDNVAAALLSIDENGNSNRVIITSEPIGLSVNLTNWAKEFESNDSKWSYIKVSDDLLDAAQECNTEKAILAEHALIITSALYQDGIFYPMTGQIIKNMSSDEKPIYKVIDELNFAPNVNNDKDEYQLWKGEAHCIIFGDNKSKLYNNFIEKLNDDFNINELKENQYVDAFTYADNNYAVVLETSRHKLPAMITIPFLATMALLYVIGFFTIMILDSKNEKPSKKIVIPDDLKEEIKE